MLARGGSVPRKVCLVCASGGHLTEMLQLVPAFEGMEQFFVTYAGARGDELATKHRAHFVPPIGLSPFALARAVPAARRILAAERPDLIVSTGSEIALPFFALAKVMRIRSVFVESWCRVESRSLTGRFVYPLADVFFVQWQQLAPRYGPKARFEGGLL
jgi:beta-1,4-N-acetylglucosaminyltransferase